MEVLLNHWQRLRKSNSFVLVAAVPPTDYAALKKLHSAIPGNLYVHWGAFKPYEIKNGAALMHSKVFYARAGDDCRLWVGSHNLTGNATQGSNCEAAVMLRGNAKEKPFEDAMRHLLTCLKDESVTVYDPDLLPPGGSEQTDIVAIHAEADGIPATPLPWHMHLCVNSADYDELLTAPADVRLFLYPMGSLNRGWRDASPIAAFSGSLTGNNLTRKNPRARLAGIDAEWRAATFSIVESRNVLVVGPGGPPGPNVTTQAVLCFDVASDPYESLFSEAPRVKTEMLPGEQRLFDVDVDPDMSRFFGKQSVVGSKLIRVPYIGRRQVIKVSEEETRAGDYEKIQYSLAPGARIPIEPDQLSKSKLEKRHPFIFRAKYRLPNG